MLQSAVPYRSNLSVPCRDDVLAPVPPGVGVRDQSAGSLPPGKGVAVYAKAPGRLPSGVESLRAWTEKVILKQGELSYLNNNLVLFFCGNIYWQVV